MREWIEISTPHLFGREREYLINCIETNYISSIGPLISKFEDKISQNVGLDSGCTTTTSSGTTALHLALIVAGVKDGDIVLTSDYTFIATANAISHARALPWLIDIEECSLTIDCNLLRETLIKETKIVNGNCIHMKTSRRVSAILPVYTLGHPPNLEILNQISKEFKIPLVSDAAAAIGSKYKSEDIGDYSLITCFSFNGNKSITSGGGGAICSKNKDLINKAKHIASTAKIGSSYNHDMIGYNYRMTNVQAAIGLGQIENIKTIIQKKREISELYDSSFNDVCGIKKIPECSWGLSSKWLSGFILNEDSDIEPEFIIRELNKNKIRVKEFWKPIHLQTPYIDSLQSNLSFSTKIWKRIIILPSYININNDDQKYVIEIIKKIFK